MEANSNKWINYGGNLICDMETASNILMLKEKTIYNLISKGELKVFKVGKKNYFTKEEIERYMKERIVLK